jgi:hypothetical protein
MERYDKVEIRCPKLGCEITFGYCRQEQGDLPCVRIIGCWQPYFPVEKYLKETMSDVDQERFFNAEPRGRMATIFETVERIKSQTGSKPES